MVSGLVRKISVLAGTVFQDTHLPMRTWFRAMWNMTSQKNGIGALGCSGFSVWALGAMGDRRRIDRLLRLALSRVLMRVSSRTRSASRHEARDPLREIQPVMFAAQPVNQVAALAISVEPKGGSVTPRGPVIYLGKL